MYIFTQQAQDPRQRPPSLPTIGGKMKKIIITGDKAKEQLLEGAHLLYDAVSTTLGPKGQNGVIQAFGEPIWIFEK